MRLYRGDLGGLEVIERSKGLLEKVGVSGIVGIVVAEWSVKVNGIGL